MFFKRKLGGKECQKCKSRIEDKFSFCPYCGLSTVNKEKEMKDFGILGSRDINEGEFLQSNIPRINLGMMDRIFSSLVSSLMKTMEQQINDFDSAEIENYPNGVRIKIENTPYKRKQKPARAIRRSLTSEQIKKMSELPRVKAKTTMRRIGDKIIYELNAPGISSTEDVFLAKLESGYEIKAIGDRKIYVNSLPVNLPLTAVSLQNDKVFIEFRTEQD